jgi:hypothetical protein
MSKSESISNLAAALVKAQSEFPAIPRNKQVTVTGQKGSYKFYYAPFEDILRAVRPALNSNGLGFTQSAAGDRLCTIILHQSGEWMLHEVGIVNPQGTAQSYGSALTYSRRYGFCTAFGIQADDDDDANAADGNTVTQQEHKPKDERNPLTAMKEDAFAALPLHRRESIRRIQTDLESLLSEGGRDREAAQIAEALSMEEQLALSSLMGSKERAALKKAIRELRGETSEPQKVDRNTRAGAPARIPQ